MPARGIMIPDAPCLVSVLSIASRCRGCGFRKFGYNKTVRPPLTIAHRGDSSRALENSLQAVQLALSLPADMIEIDIRKSLDHVLYVMHDRETGRTAEQNIDIERSTSERISRVHLKNGEPIPRLVDVLSLVAGAVGLNLELKSDGAGGLAVEALRSSGYPGPVVVSSFKEPEVLEVRRLEPRLRAGVIYDVFTRRDVDPYAAKGLDVISLRKKTVTRELVAACRHRELSVYVWTVDDEDDMRRLIDWGVDGIYTNRPLLLKEVIHRLEQKQAQ